MKLKLNSLPLTECHCVLCADEISSKNHLFYNILKDEIIGFEDTGYKKKNLLFDIIIKLRNCDAIMHALMTDMGSNFMKLSRARNNLLKYNFKINNKIVSLNYTLYNFINETPRNG
ncbi:hypothetical protein ALC56_07135 [Trachymyrmex septentrionalis]|uniref:Transposable element P transposase-like RNase H domain-containing protein n=1 Tax=Trachymyrmex septentrionalis TaxID=34720 RepID=A0A151JW94_9HYME|nr:hypothetical protein ALC56_07135 [Trachymyrmex septentrionalis]